MAQTNRLYAHKASRMWGLILATVVLATLELPAPAPAQTNAPSTPEVGILALVVGVDEYPNLGRESQLGGAVADALDIYRALSKAGVKDVELLTNQAVTRTSFVQAIERLIEKAQKNDLAIISFAGHGSQELENPSDPNSPKFESFILSYFDPLDPSKTLERIKDKEIFDWLGQLDSKGAKTIFLADSCHGGGMSKALDQHRQGVKVRSLNRVYSKADLGSSSFYIPPGIDLLPSVQKSSTSQSVNGELATTYYSSVTFLAAVDAQHEVPEIRIDPEPSRGALSYSFARAIDAVGDMQSGLTRGALFKFLHSRVLALTNQKQYIVFEPDTPETATALLLQKQASGIAPASNRTAEASPKPSVDALSDQRIRWNPGDVQAALRSVFETLHVKQLKVGVSPSPPHYKVDQHFDLKIEGLYRRALILVNVAGDGEVQFLFPVGNADPIITDDALNIGMLAKPPLGNDTIIALALARRNADLEFDLSNLNGKKQPEEFVELIRKYFSPGDLAGLTSYQTSW